jgi:drug/metabolite transporter (DMT)-like permease
VSTIPASPASQSDAASARRRSVILVSGCTVLNAIAQILFKMGAHNLVLTPMGLLTNVPLIAGCAFYGLFTIAMVIALREAELSVMYPIIALSYVWVTLLTYWLLKETPNLYKNLGIVTIVIGVAVLGRGGKK